MSAATETAPAPSASDVLAGRLFDACAILRALAMALSSIEAGEAGDVAAAALEVHDAQRTARLARRMVYGVACALQECQADARHATAAVAAIAEAAEEDPS